MEKILPLYELLEALEFGSRYHIAVEFLNPEFRGRMGLTRGFAIQNTAVCKRIKQKSGALDRCLRCKGEILSQIRQTAKPVSGPCVHGVYLYNWPVFYKNVLLCTIRISNILTDPGLICQACGITPSESLLATMEVNMGEEMCEQICRVIESFILMRMDAMMDAPDLDNHGHSINATVTAVKAYVEANYHRDITLSQLAARHHYNEKYLGSLFKQQVGKSFHSYLNDHRLKIAHSLLYNTSQSIISVSNQAGFQNVTYFNRLFKSKYGITPTQYRAGLSK